MDPYRTLGLEPGASSAEVKRAYRRLAKAFHPDSAGEAALPRFLAIHEAYEAIRLGRPVGASRAGARAAERSEPAPTAEPWRADPAKARAARERARTGRARAGAGGPAGRGSDPRGRSSGAPGTGGPGEPGGPTRSTGSSGTSGTRGRRGGTRKATLGSTSYDEARDPSDASWSGAAWYGPTTGEYWIINPREYADPRKHGPDYQSRARRRAADPSISSTVEDEPPFVSTPVDEADVDPEHAARWAGPGATPSQDGGDPERGFETRAAAADPGRARTRAGRATAPGARAAARPRRPAPDATADAAWDAARIREARRSSGRAGAVADQPAEGAGRRVPSGVDPARAWLGGTGDDQVSRLGSALVAWPPIGLAAATAIGDVTGCNAYSVACGDVDRLLPWLAQAAILGLLLLLPALGRLLAGGTVAVLIALVPVTAFLLVVGGAGAPQAGFALAFLLGTAWILGVAGSIVAASRRRRPSSGGGPA